MKRWILSAVVAACATTAFAAPRAPVQRTTFTAPFAHPADPTYPIEFGTQHFRWGWFGADHYPTAPVMHRDYTRGWREWHSRR